MLSTHLAAFGLMSCLADQRIDTLLHADDGLLRIDAGDAEPDRVVAAIRHAAAAAREAIDADITVNGLVKPLLIAGPAAGVVTERDRLLDRAERDSPAVASMISGISTVIPAGNGLNGETVMVRSPLDGAPRNAASDLIRGVIRHVRRHAENATFGELIEPRAGDDRNLDGWTPRGTPISPTLTWLAALGLGWFPVVGHTEPHDQWPYFAWTAEVPGLVRALLVERPGPGSGAEQHGRIDAIAIPVVGEPVTLPRMRALLNRAEITIAAHTTDRLGAAAAGRLRALGVRDVAVFHRQRLPSKHMVGFTFDQAEFQTITPFDDLDRAVRAQARLDANQDERPDIQTERDDAVRAALAAGHSQTAIALRLGLSQARIAQIRDGRR